MFIYLICGMGRANITLYDILLIIYFRIKAKGEFPFGGFGVIGGKAIIFYSFKVGFLFILKHILVVVVAFMLVV